MLSGLKMFQFSKIMTAKKAQLPQTPSAGLERLGEGGGLSAEPSPRKTVSALPSICLIFCAFKLFCIVTLE